MLVATPQLQTDGQEMEIEIVRVENNKAVNRNMIENILLNNLKIYIY
jgi:hypothetical protein